MTIGRTRASVLIAGMLLVFATASSVSAAVASPYAKCFQTISKASQSYVKSKLKLTKVPVEDNAAMIYGELGVYTGELLGTPCDDF